MLTLRRQHETRPFFSDFFNELFNDEYFWPTGASKPESVVPALNVKEDEKEILLELVVPGFKKDDIKISLDKDVLTISSEVKEEKESDDKENNFLKREFYYNSFKRCVRIPEEKIDNGKILANYEDGILKLHLPKREEPINPSRLIDIQ
jgi:HSP20 family protein